MPEMNGRALAARIKAHHPDVCVLYISGHPEDIIARPGILDPEVSLLNKPFGPSELLDRIRTLLDQPASSSKAAKTN